MCNLGSMTKECLPPLWHLFLLDAVLAKVQVGLIDENESADSSANTLVQELIPHVLRLTQAILHCTKWSLLNSVVEQSDPPGKYTLQDFESIQEALAIASTRNTLTSSLTSEFNSLLPQSVSKVLQTWNTTALDECTWVSMIDLTTSINSFLQYFIIFTLLSFRHHI